jgi:hypothetical protein
MGTYEPNADYRNMKPYKLNQNSLSLVDVLGGVTADKARELYRGPKPVGEYLRMPTYLGLDPLTRSLVTYRGNIDLQPDMVAAKKALKQI